MFVKSIAVLLVITGVSLASPIGPNAILKPNPKGLLVECYYEDREMVKDLLQSKRSDLEKCGWKNQTEMLRLYDENIQIFLTSEPELMRLVDEMDECPTEELYQELMSFAESIFEKIWDNLLVMDDFFQQETEEAKVCFKQAWTEMAYGLFDFIQSMGECLYGNLLLPHPDKILTGK